MKNKRLMVGILSVFVLVGMMVVPTFAQEVEIMPIAESEEYIGNCGEVSICCTIQYSIKSDGTIKIQGVTNIRTITNNSVLQNNVFTLKSSTYSLLNGGQSVNVEVSGTIQRADIWGNFVVNSASYSYTFTPVP